MHLTPANGIGSLRSTKVIAAQVILNVGRKIGDLEVTADGFREVQKGHSRAPFRIAHFSPDFGAGRSLKEIPII